MDELLLLWRHCPEYLVWLLWLTWTTWMTETYRTGTSGLRTIHGRTHRFLMWRGHDTRWDLLRHVWRWRDG